MQEVKERFDRDLRKVHKEEENPGNRVGSDGKCERSIKWAKFDIVRQCFGHNFFDLWILCFIDNTLGKAPLIHPILIICE
jgi:hypothetical protein